MLGVGAPAQASASAHGTASVNTSAAGSTGYASAATGTENTSNVGAAAATGSTYTVKSGDTLGRIAAKHGVSLGTVLSLNGLSASTIIYPGDSVKISGTASVSGVASGASTGDASTSGYTAPAQTAADSSGSAAATADAGVSFASSNVQEIPASSVNATILDSAQSQLRAIQDCTVLGEKALRAAGISGVGDESPESLMQYATQVSNPQPGDFIYYADGGLGFSHNAVYIGGGKAIHSGWNGNQTVVKSVDVGSGPVYYRVNG